MNKFFLAVIAAVALAPLSAIPASAGMRCHVEGVVIGGVAYEDKKCWYTPSEIIVRHAPPRYAPRHYRGRLGYRPRAYLAPRPIGRPVSIGHPVRIGRPVYIGR